MSDWQSRTVEVNGLTLHYTRTGGDKPTVVLAHGFSDDGLCWTPVAKQLEADYDLVSEWLKPAKPTGHNLPLTTNVDLARPMLRPKN